MDLDRAAADPAVCAEQIAADVDRLRLAIADRMKVHAPAIAGAHGLAPSAVMAAAYLRNVYPDRKFDPRGVLAVFTYQSADQARAGLDALVASAHLATVTPTQLGLTDAGRSLLSDMVSAADAVAQQLWPDTAALNRITPLAERAVAAFDDAGETVAVMTPAAGNPARLSPAGWFAELLTALRFHRFDSHIAAWRAAGLTVEQIKHLESGPQRDAIEAETNRRAGKPYGALSSAERAELLAGVAALPS